MARWARIRPVSRSFHLPLLRPRRIAAGGFIAIFLLAGCISFLHHHHDLQSSTPCPICYAMHLPARVGTGVDIPQSAVFAFVAPVLIQIAAPEPSLKDCPPRAPPA